LETARKHLFLAIVGAALVVAFIPALIEYYPYDVKLKTVYVRTSNALWGGVLNNSALILPPTTAIVLPSVEGDFLQPSGKHDYVLMGDVSSNASMVFAILDNNSFNEFRRNTSAIVNPLIRNDIVRGQRVNITLPLANNGPYFYLFLSRESSANVEVGFNLNETWSYPVIEPETQFSIVKGILPPVGVSAGGVLLALSLLKLRKLATEAPETQAGDQPVGTQA
jgi:hypothetical protein